MIHYLLVTYAHSPHTLTTGIVLVILAALGTFTGAYALGTTGLKTTHGTYGDRQRLIATPVLILVFLAAVHVALPLAAAIGVDRTTPRSPSRLLDILLGPAEYDPTKLGIGAGILLLAGLIATLLVHLQMRDGGQLREAMSRLRDPARRYDDLGSAAFVVPRQMAHLQRPKGEHDLALLGAFYGTTGRGERQQLQRIDYRPSLRRKQLGKIVLSSEDQARGIVIMGPPGTGKSQAGILPIVADSMQAGQSLVVLDPQNELLRYIEDYARVTGHRMIVHDPTDPATAHFNLAEDVANVSDAQAIARVIAGAGGSGRMDNDFWMASAQNLLAGCLLRFETLGGILGSFGDMKRLAKTLASENDGAANLTRAWVASVRADDRSAPGILASLQASTISAWAEENVREATDSTQFSARDLVDAPTVIVLKCPGRYMKVYGPYLAAVLQKLMLDLDEIGESTPDGALVRPVKIAADEFAVLGRLDAVVEAVNLFRKRRISFVIAFQSMAQLDTIYGRDGAKALIGGLATQIIFGSCDLPTAQYVAQSLGKATRYIEQQSAYPGRAPHVQIRTRELLTIDEIMTPPRGNCIILHRYATATYAAQVVMLAHLTPMWQRQDWEAAIRRAKSQPTPTGDVKRAQAPMPVFEASQLFGRREKPLVEETAREDGSRIGLSGDF